MEFCPTCANMLLYERATMGKPGRFSCSTCPYVCNIEKNVVIERHLRLVKKPIDPILSQADLDQQGTQETNQANCPNCGHQLAAFIQVQTRSADEPMTIFYKCRKCRHDWKEG